MSLPEIKVVERTSVCHIESVPDMRETRIIWLALLHALAIFQAGLRKFLKLDARCDYCGK